MLLLDKVDQVSITILVDNHTDILLASLDNVQRPPIISKKNNGYLIQIAEHGFASLIEIKYDNNSKASKFLFDAGVSAEGLLFNANIAMDKDRQQRALRPIACILNEGHIQGHLPIIIPGSSSAPNTDNFTIYWTPFFFASLITLEEMSVMLSEGNVSKRRRSSSRRHYQNNEVRKGFTYQI